MECDNTHVELFRNGFDGIKCQPAGYFYLIENENICGNLISNTAWNFLNKVYGCNRDHDLFQKIEKQRIMTKLGDHRFDVNTINLTENDLRKHRRSFLEIYLHIDCDILDSWIHFQAVRYNCYVIASREDMTRNCTLY